MRRKSERNKAKGTPEKKVEKPSRRTTRRRGKATPTPSPERENADDNVSSTPYSDDEKESHLQSEEQSNDNDHVEKGVSSSELIKSVLGGDDEDNGSVWKVARADASPGEIQKLKLCRQRNISEASDSSMSKKKSNKWQESGEGGMEEADSADEQIASSQMSIREQTDDPSSSHPGQDSSEEVSDYKENLPETTSANLSDDQTNIDQRADFKENLPETTSTSLPEQPNYEENQSSSPLVNLPGDNLGSVQSPDSGNNIAEFTSGSNQQNENIQDNSNEPTCFKSATTESRSIDINPNMNDDCTNEAIPSEDNVQNNDEKSNDKSIITHEDDAKREDSLSRQDTVQDQETPINEDKNSEAVAINNETVDIDFTDSCKELKNDDEEEGEIREETGKEQTPESDTKNESDTQDVHYQEKDSHSAKQKHSKYRESSTSDTPESGNEENTMANNKEAQENEADSSIAEEKTKKSRKEKKSNRQKSKSNDVEDTSISISIEPEIDLSESNIDKEDILEITEKSDDLNVSLSTSKPAKVSLKRSFSTRLSTDSETKKEESNTKKSISESNQNKENHADNEQPDQKSATKRRRWGMTTTTDVAPAFSISTDSLNALVPGAKPLSVNEVKLTKDEDEEKEHRKSKSEFTNDQKLKTEVVLKNDVAKRGETKMDNHIVRRKITVVKETPRPKSPSPPEAQATNILLIRNLVRPFTLNQIKELLSRTGTIVENGFWMDRIKSKCYVEYANEDQAFETRQALHGVSWPLSNPKKLIVEYATKEDMESAREISKDQPPARKTEPLVSNDLWPQDHWSRDERPTVVNKITVIREWDLGKEDGQLHVKEKERERKEFEKKKRQRSRSPVLEVHLPAPARKFKKKEEEPPTAKLLDDLFRKTKSTPCIYWLPLTNEQIIVKEEMRRQHMAEHARRLEEMRRAERNRDTRRRRSPRK